MAVLHVLGADIAQQGLAFLTRYRKLSPQDAQSLEEVEYNYGRAFHGLGEFRWQGAGLTSFRCHASRGLALP